MKRLVLALTLLCSVSAWGAITFVSASNIICSQTSASTGAACTLTGPTTAGNLVIVGLTWTSSSTSINYVAGNATGSYFFPYAEVCNNGGSCSAILICRDCSALTAVTPNFIGQTNYNLSVEEYSGVTAIGVTRTANGTSTTPGIAITTGDANDWLVAVVSSLGNAGVPTAGTGNLRNAASTGSTSNDAAGAACDNTAATAGSLSCAATIASGAWSAAGVELRTSYLRTYVWPDCDATHPCVIHEKDTVALGTGTDTLTGPFKITVPPTLPGNLMKLTVSHPNSATISSITDDQSNTWTAGATTTDSSHAETTEVRYVCGAAAGTSVITVAFSNAIVDGDVAQFSYDEVSGIGAASCGDGDSGFSGGQGILNPGPITTTSSGDMVFTFGICASGAMESGNQAGVSMPDDTSAKIAENDFDQFMSMVEVQASAGVINPTLYANAQDVNNTAGLGWNIVSQAFKASSGAGTQPSGIQVVTDQHFINWNVLGWNPLPSNGNAIVFSTSNPSAGWGMTNLTDNYGTTYARTAYTDPTVDPQQYSACLGSNVSGRDRIFSYTPDKDQTHVEIYTIAGADNLTGTGCVGTTVNHAVGTQGPILNDNIVGDPVITPTINAGYNSVIIATSYVGTGPPSGMCTSGGVTPPTCTGQSAGVVFNSIYATGMTDQSSWSTGDPFVFFYTNSTSPRSMDYLMANGTSGTALYGAAIEILGGPSTTAPVMITPSVTVTPSALSVTTAQTLSVTVAVNGGTGYPTPTGTVTLTGGGYTSAATTLSSGNAVISIPAGSLATGSDTLTADYTPDTSSSTIYNSATGSALVTVMTELMSPTVTVTPSPSSITAAQSLSVTVAVNGGSGNPTPTGTVVLTGGGFTSVVTTLTSGTTTINIPAGSLATGSDTLTVTYTPDTSSSTIYNNASGSALVTVTTPATITPTVTVTPSSSSITTTQSLSVTVAVNGGGGNPTPTGTVVLTGGGFTSVVTTLTSGTTTISIAAGLLGTGTDALTVTYTPDTSSSTTYNSASGSALVTVTTPAKITPAVTVIPSSLSITTTQSLSVTVAVNGGSGNPTPTGTVTLAGGGYATAATALSGGAATIIISQGLLGTGTDALTVTYTPDTSSSTIYNNASGSALVTVTTPATITPTVTVTPSSSSITTTQSLSVTVAVNGGSGNPTPTGTVTLAGGGYASAPTALSGGTATIIVSPGLLGTGTDTLTVTYTPDTSSSTTYNSASGSASVTVSMPTTITPAVTVTPSSLSITTTQSLSVTIAVNGGSGNPTPTGTVVLTGGGYTSAAATLSTGSATINTPAGSLAIGSDTLTATYTPDVLSATTYNGATGSAAVTVTQQSNPDFTLSNSGGITVIPGATIGNTSTITITPSGGFTGTVTLSCSVTTALTNPIAPPTCAMGATSVNIAGTSPATATITITTTAATTGALSPLLKRFLIPDGLALAVVCFLGLPARRRYWRRAFLLPIFCVGVAGLGCGTSVAGGGGTGTNSSGTTAGTYTVTVTGTSGSLTQNTTVSVKVN